MMLIEEAIESIKLRATPKTLRDLLETCQTKVFPHKQGSPRVTIEGRPSGNLRIEFRSVKGDSEFFIIGLEQFYAHPLKINQWK